MKLLLAVLLTAQILLMEVFAEPPVLQGVDRIETPPYSEILANKRIGLWASLASLDRQGKRTIDIIAKNPKFHLTALYAAEHGLCATKTTFCENDIEPVTKLPIRSLYGFHHKNPSAKDLEGVDIILIDMQDVGLRYYTFTTTLAYMLKAAKKFRKKVVILDRVNPLSGSIIEGIIPEKKYQRAFTGYYPIPMRYGMTFGELARYYNQFFEIHASLTVVPLRNWNRNDLFNQTDLTWHAPSPALQTFQQTMVYAIFGTLEAMDFDVGRGLDGDPANNQEAFLKYGAPWMTKIQAENLVKELNDLHLPGLHFSYSDWKGGLGPHENEKCFGFKVHIDNYQAVRAFYSLIEALKVIYRLFGEKTKIDEAAWMIGSIKVIDQIKHNVPTHEIIEHSSSTLHQFLKNRQKALLYH